PTAEANVRKVVEAEVKKAAAKTEASEDKSSGFVNQKILKIPSQDPISNQYSAHATPREKIFVVFGFIVIALGFLLMVISFNIGLVVAIFGGLLIASIILLSQADR